ncbi:MAG: alpha-glucan family phosphorylase, partial [Candidatus Sumerlaeota bacterium]
YPGHVVHAQIWQLMVGRTRLLLLDTNLPRNAPDDQDITAQLYGGGHDMRVKQEILMGVGGIRALKAAGVKPTIYHMNEGHSAFLGLERIRFLMDEMGVDFDAALQAVRASNCFTTHTPVAAGNDAFAPETITYFFKEYVPKLGIHMDRFLGLGRQNKSDQHEHFSMTVLALHLAAHCNGVSQLHGKVSRNMWKGVYPGVTEDEVPIRAITNGIHTSTWISREMANLYDRYLGPDWAEDPTNAKTWDLADRIPEAELWRTHERRRERLVAFARKRLVQQLEQRGAPQREMEQAEEVLDPEALTIGFARRFALYKRGTLLLRDKDRLRALLANKERPVQMIFAGKAHPADTMAKEIIRELVHFMRDPEIRRRIVFLEDYDMNVARYLVQGCDVWLNTPRRPLEASGTSGMKAAANGALNLSILDGWWVEGYNRDVGWAIGNGEEYDDLELQDSIESQALYDMLEKEVVPVFYGRAADGLPRAWLSRMKACIQQLSGAFGTARMLNDYVLKSYLPAAQSGGKLLDKDLESAKNLSDWLKHVHKHWDGVKLKQVKAPDSRDLPVGESLPVEVTLQLGEIKPADVLVQLYHGKLNPKEEITDARTTVLDFDHSNDGTHVFKGEIETDCSGKFGFAVRVLPHNDLMATMFDAELVYWA